MMLHVLHQQVDGNSGSNSFINVLVTNLLLVSMIVRIRISCRVTPLSLKVVMVTSLNCTVLFPLLATTLLLCSSIKTDPVKDKGESTTVVLSKVKATLSLPAKQL